jgi:hypothetical protein
MDIVIKEIREKNIEKIRKETSIEIINFFESK